MASEGVPLTFGQMSTLRHLQKWPRERWPEGNIIYRHRIVSTSASVDDVRELLNEAALLHGALRTTFDLSDIALPLHTVHERMLFDPLVVATADEADEAARTAPHAKFDFGSDHGWQATLLLDAAGKPAELILVVSHLIADGWSMRRIGQVLTPLIGAVGSDDDVPFAGLTTDLAILQRGDEWVERRTKAEAYWRDFFVRVPGDRLQREGVGATAQHANKGSLSLGPQGAAIAAIARRARAFPTGVILAFLGLALLRSEEGESMPFVLMAANRNIPGWQEVVSSLNQQIPVLLHRPAPEESVHRYVAQVQRMALAAYQNGCYDVDMADRVAAEVLPGIPKSFGPMINFTAAGESVDAGALGVDESADRVEPTVEPSPHGIAFDVYIEVNDVKGIDIKLFSIDHVLSAPALLACLKWITDAIALTAERDELRIADLPVLDL